MFGTIILAIISLTLLFISPYLIKEIFLLEKAEWEIEELK
jgi:hypothetical protein